MTERFLIFGDSNSWGFPGDSSGIRFDAETRWPQVMARRLGVEIVEDCLPGRTTRFDDPLLIGADFAHSTNGLLHLPASLAAHSPVDHLLIMLGTNDLKLRFRQSATDIAENLGTLVNCARRVGGRAASWEDLEPPQITVIVPVPIGPQSADPEWERAAEWKGGLAKSHEIGVAIRSTEGFEGVGVIEAGTFATTSQTDPIHMDAANQRALGEGIALALHG